MKCGGMINQWGSCVKGGCGGEGHRPSPFLLPGCYYLILVVVVAMSSGFTAPLAVAGAVEACILRLRAVAMFLAILGLAHVVELLTRIAPLHHARRLDSSVNGEHVHVDPEADIF